MAVADTLIKILVCPSTRQSTKIAPKKLLKLLNRSIQDGTLQDVGGNPVTEPLEGLLLREDKTVGYPIRNGVPEMLAERGIEISDSDKTK
jgi:uncharacterized protein YbaR (Trm112 family)